MTYFIQKIKKDNEPQGPLTIEKITIEVDQIYTKKAYRPGAQPEIFQGRGGFVEFGHFNKHYQGSFIF